MQNSNLTVEAVGNLDPQYECPICLSCLKEPILTSCGHRFCSACLNLWLESKGESCPVDGGPLNKKLDLFPDHFTRREILNRRTVCRLCKTEIGLSEMDEHLLIHSESSGKSNEGCCPFQSVGCDVEVSEESLKEHLAEDITLHLSLIANSHLNLQEKVKNSDKMSEAIAQESLMWDPQEKGKQQNASLMRALYERVVVLEQRCHEQNAQIEKLKAEVQESDAKIREVALQHACGQYLWKISEFSKKVADMKSNNTKVFFSEGFYTSPIGYKICGRINLFHADSDQLSLLVHLMQTSHDYTLNWPFTGRIHLAVIHPTNSSWSVSETIMSRPDLGSFMRPTRNINMKAFGFPQFISINKIFKDGFLVNDTLTVKMYIQQV